MFRALVAQVTQLATANRTAFALVSSKIARETLADVADHTGTDAGTHLALNLATDPTRHRIFLLLQQRVTVGIAARHDISSTGPKQKNMTCVWRGLVSALHLKCKPRRLVQYLLDNNVETVQVKWNGTELEKQQRKENYMAIKQLSHVKEKLGNGYTMVKYMSLRR